MKNIRVCLIVIVALLFSVNSNAALVTAGSPFEISFDNLPSTFEQAKLNNLQLGVTTQLGVNFSFSSANQLISGEILGLKFFRNTDFTSLYDLENFSSFPGGAAASGFGISTNAFPDLNGSIRLDAISGSVEISSITLVYLDYSKSKFLFYGIYTAPVITPGPLPIAAVPEPSSYALMIAGLGLVGLIARRRQSEITG